MTTIAKGWGPCQWGCGFNPGYCGISGDTARFDELLEKHPERDTYGTCGVCNDVLVPESTPPGLWSDPDEILAERERMQRWLRKEQVGRIRYALERLWEFLSAKCSRRKRCRHQNC